MYNITVDDSKREGSFEEENNAWLTTYTVCCVHCAVKSGKNNDKNIYIPIFFLFSFTFSFFLLLIYIFGIDFHSARPLGQAKTWY